MRLATKVLGLGSVDDLELCCCSVGLGWGGERTALGLQDAYHVTIRAAISVPLGALTQAKASPCFLLPWGHPLLVLNGRLLELISLGCLV